MKSATILGQQLKYIDEGQGTPVVFVHGTPSSSAEFQKVIAQLKSNYRCLALDHLGFGQSAKPPTGDYSLQAHSERFQAWLVSLNLPSYHLVVTDFGGAIALPVAARSWTNLRSLTLINTWAWPLSQTEPTLNRQRPVMTSRLMRWLYLYGNFSPRVLVKAAWGRYRPLDPLTHHRYLKPFPRPRDRHGCVAFLQALFDDQNPAWKTFEALTALAPKPTLILWGEADRMISTRNRERWQKMIPHARTESLPRVGHFVCDEAPELAGPKLAAFLAQA